MTRRSRQLLAATLTAVVLVGCGGSGDAGPDRASDSPASTTAGGSRPGSSGEGGGGKAEGGGGAKGKGEGDANAEGVRRLSSDERSQEVARVQQTVRELLEAMNARDESVCSRLFDQHLIEEDKRDQAVEACKRGIANQPGGLELVEFEFVRVREKNAQREALVQFLARQSRRRTTRFGFHLIESDSGYKFDRSFAVKQPGQ